MSVTALRQRLRQYRLDRRLSYEELGRELGLGAGSARNFILGKSKPYEITVHAVKQYLDRVDSERVSA